MVLPVGSGSLRRRRRLLRALLAAERLDAELSQALVVRTQMVLERLPQGRRDPAALREHLVALARRFLLAGSVGIALLGEPVDLREEVLELFVSVLQVRMLGHRLRRERLGKHLQLAPRLRDSYTGHRILRWGREILHQ